MKLISVIIPCYNTQSYITDCINSVITQTYQNSEIICVDDGSTDNSPILLQEFKEKYPNRITVVSTANKGAPAARNLGLKMAKGEYIQFLDADDLIVSDKFEKQIVGFTEGIDMVISDRIRKNENLSIILNECIFADINVNPLETAVRKIIITGNPLYLKKTLLELGGYNEKLNSAQDWELHIQLVLKGCRIKYVPGAFFISRHVKDSLSSNWKKVSIQAAEIVIQLKPELEKSKMMNESIQQYFSQIYIDSAIFCENEDLSNRYINELKYWSNSNYAFIKNNFKRMMIHFFGIVTFTRMYKFFMK